MMLTFDHELVKRLMDHAQNAPEHRQTYGETGQGPGLLLVGDRGVYLMSNGLPVLQRQDAEEGASIVAYARECDPTTLPFDVWWENKRASFGGDDGVEFIPLDKLPANGKLKIELDPETYAIHEIA